MVNGEFLNEIRLVSIQRIKVTVAKLRPILGFSESIHESKYL